MPKEILIAGSDITDQEEFQKIFEATDHRLVFSDKAEEALLRIKLFKPDLIIAGQALSGEGGLEFCESIKADPEFKEIPIVLVSGILGEVSERDRERVKADGVINTPLNEGEVLKLIEGLIEKDMLRFAEATGKGRKQGEWIEGIGGDPSSENGELSLELGEMTDEEIIDLIDVVEEPESKMSIDDFVTAKEGESYGEISFAPLMEKAEAKEEEKPFGELDFLNLGEKEIIAEEESARTPEKKEPERVEATVLPAKEESAEEELFEKIDLEEILAKVDQIRPSIEQEWPKEKQTGPAEGSSKPGTLSSLSTEEIPKEDLFNLEEFETALKREVKEEEPEADLHPFSFEEVSAEPPEEKPIEEVAAEEEELEDAAEEAFPEALFEEMLGEEEIKDLEELKEEEAVIEEAVSQEAMIRETIMQEPAMQEAPSQEPAIQEPVIQEPLSLEPVSQESAAETAKAFPFEMFEDEGKAAPEAKPTVEEPRLEREDIFKMMEAPLVSQEVTSPMIKTFEKQLEQVVAKGVQDMIGDFITKILPEMTQNIMNLTAERIEKMVKDIVPDLAEKAIREEIKRLQKEVKE
jgi:CheY-like chemotaxis protein